MSGQTFVITLQGSAYFTNMYLTDKSPISCLAITITLHFKQLRHAAEPGFLTVQSLPLNQADFLQSALFVSVSIPEVSRLSATGWKHGWNIWPRSGLDGRHPWLRESEGI